MGPGHFLAAVPKPPCPQEYLEFRKERSQMLLSRRNQLLLEFSFWNEPQPRAGPNIYELRTYKLKVPPPPGPRLSPTLPAAALLSWYPEVGGPGAPASRLGLLAPEQRCVCMCAHVHTQV